MKTKQQKIQQFKLSPLVKAGLDIKKLQDEARKDEHDHTRPHRDTHYLLMLSTHGHFKLSLEFKELAVPSPALLLILPGQVHHIVEVHQPRGWVISFDPSLIDNELQVILEQGGSGPVLLEEQRAFFDQAVALMDLIEKLHSGIHDAYTGRTTHSLLKALLGLIAGKTLSLTSGNVTKESRGAAITKDFMQLLKQHYKTWKQPARYAAALNISEAHLYGTVKGVTGSSVTLRIQEYSILEAKRLLCFTDLPVREVGYECGYNDPVYFGKLFKKTTGQTPLQFRQQYHD